VIRLGAVGDVVRTLPAVSALRAAYPGAHVAWLVERTSAGALDGNPWIDEVLVFPRESLRDALVGLRPLAAVRELRAFLRKLRRRRFDLVLDFHSILKSGLLARASGAGLRVGYAPPYGRELSWLFHSRRARLTPTHVSRFDRNQGLLRFLGVRAEPRAGALRVDLARVHAYETALGDGPAPVAIHPGTSDATPHKRWTPEGYGRLARELFQRDGVPSIVTFGPARADRSFAEAVVAASEGAARLAPPTPSLADLAALFACVRLYVGSDTGPLHVASLVGTPVVQIIGPTDPVENAPWQGTPSRTVRVPVACSPCRRGCAAATCMRVVPAEAVIAAARELLADARKPRAPGAGVRSALRPGGRLGAAAAPAAIARAQGVAS
jgi:3-deoxy-D-manno-octulosonic-acid transferase/heptosyltransferase-1